MNSPWKVATKRRCLRCLKVAVEAYEEEYLYDSALALQDDYRQLYRTIEELERQLIVYEQALRSPTGSAKSTLRNLHLIVNIMPGRQRKAAARDKS